MGDEELHTDPSLKQNIKQDGNGFQLNYLLQHNSYGCIGTSMRDLKPNSSQNVNSKLYYHVVQLST